MVYGVRETLFSLYSMKEECWGFASLLSFLTVGVSYTCEFATDFSGKGNVDNFCYK